MTRAGRIAALAMAAAAAAPATAQPAGGRAEVLILGTYHMASPGHDIFNAQADDVLAPRRQAEMAQLAAVLKKFDPTKIAVEREANDKRIVKDYEDYLAGRHELTRNEIEQIGFRLARELGHKIVYAVDADGDFPYPRLVKYAKATGRSKELDAIMGEFEKGVKAQNAYLASHNVLETLLFLNSDEKAEENRNLYHRMAHLGEPYDWAGADLVADWFRRNMRIFSNIAQLAGPGDRILVLYGSGHLPWLQDAVAADATLRLRKLADFAGAAAAASSPPERESPARDPRLAAAIRKANGEFEVAMTKGDTAAIAAPYTPDAVFVSPDGTATKGRDRIEQLYRDRFARSGPALETRIESEDLRIDGDFAYESGTGSMTRLLKGERVTDRARFLTVWQRQPDGDWKISRNIVLPAR